MVIAVLATWLAAIQAYAFETRIYRSSSRMILDPLPEVWEGSRATSQHDPVWDQVLGAATSSDSIARVLAAPAVASLPSLKALPDPAAEVRRHLTARVIPDSVLIEVSMTWTSGPDAAAIVNAVVADAIAVASFSDLRLINPRRAGRRSDTPFHPSRAS